MPLFLHAHAHTHTPIKSDVNALFITHSNLKPLATLNFVNASNVLSARTQEEDRSMYIVHYECIHTNRL